MLIIKILNIFLKQMLLRVIYYQNKISWYIKELNLCVCVSKYTRTIWSDMDLIFTLLFVYTTRLSFSTLGRFTFWPSTIYLTVLTSVLFEHGVLKKEVTTFSLTRVYRATWNARSQGKEVKDNVGNEGARRVGVKSEQVLPIFALSAYNPYR